MLDRDHVKALINYAWSEIGCGICIPADWGDFFDRNGRAGSSENERRRYARYYFRDRAVLIEGKTTMYCVYTADISCSGVAVLHLEQLFPKQRFQICLPNGTMMGISIERCLRMGEFCYECGAAFVAGLSAPGEAASVIRGLPT